MAMDTGNLSDAVKTLYERRLLTRALPRLIHGRFGMQATWKGYGSYEVRRWESLAVVTSTLTEGTTPNEHAGPTITTTTLTPDWYGAWVKYTDKLIMTAFDPVVSETSKLLGEQAGLSVDTVVRNALTDNATKDYSGGATSRTTIDKTNDIIAFVDFIQAVATLEANNARPVEGPYYVVIIHPHTWATLVQDSTFMTLFTREGGASVRSGYIGTILNCAIYITSNAREYVDGGQNSTEDIYSMLFIGAESHALAGLTGLFPNMSPDSGGETVRGGMTGQDVKSVEIVMFGLGETGFDPLKQRGTIGWKCAHVESVLNSSWIIDLEHANDFS
jgi:N4-gp56 family major capsid protein